MLVLTIVRS